MILRKALLTLALTATCVFATEKNINNNLDESLGQLSKDNKTPQVIVKEIEEMEKIEKMETFKIPHFRIISETDYDKNDAKEEH